VLEDTEPYPRSHLNKSSRSLDLAKAVSEPVTQLLDSMRLLVDLQRVSEVVQRLNGCLDPDEIAKRATDGLIEQFHCAFARIWLMEPDRASLRLVASSGIYTRTDGFFARVPVGSFKVGKIAQNRIPFLSNHLPDEPWVKDRQWAIEHNITGFAGYPLAIGDTVTGVMAIFSYHPLTPEFLEVLQGLCTTLAITLENALLHRRQIQCSNSIHTTLPLSDRLADILTQTRLSLVGTERPLSTSVTCMLLRMAEILAEVDCTYCRLIYEADYIALEAMVFPPEVSHQTVQDWAVSRFGSVLLSVTCLGGTLQTLAGANQKLFQVALRVPYPSCKMAAWLRIHCAQPILQTAFTHLAYQAGFNVCSVGGCDIPLLTDDVAQIKSSRRILWIDDGTPSPSGIVGKVNLQITPAELREAVSAVIRGESWGLSAAPESVNPGLSEREREILSLLAEGLRDRDIANRLHISERTVKFHLNNVLAKLEARTRCQAIYQSTVKGWIG
jgi:DNA-binding CsgD family transcriptional regulator